MFLYHLFFNHEFTDLLWNSLPLSTHILYGFLLDSFKMFWKALVTVIPFLSFKGITQAYLLKISITHNKERLAPQILSVKNDCTFLFLNFLIIVLYNSTANFLLKIFSFLTPLPDVFYRKIYKPLKQVHVGIHRILDL